VGGWVGGCFCCTALNFCDISGFGVVAACLVAALNAKLNLEAAGPEGGCLGACGGGVSPFCADGLLGAFELSNLVSDRPPSALVSLGGRDSLVSSSFALLALLLAASSVCDFGFESRPVDSCLACPDVERGPVGAAELHCPDLKPGGLWLPLAPLNWPALYEPGPPLKLPR
jgi:hypothetical protein